MKLYIMRHGETPWNALRKIQGIADIPLNENGRRLAAATGEALRDVPFDFAISSPLQRAVETAQLVIGERDIPIYTDPRIQEINFGQLEGVQLIGAEADPEAAKRMDDFFHHTMEFRAAEGGEEIHEVCARTKDFLYDLAGRKEYEDKTILITSHGCAVRALLQSVYPEDGNFWRGKVPPNCAVNILEVKDGNMTLVEEDKVYY